MNSLGAIMIARDMNLRGHIRTCCGKLRGFGVAAFVLLALTACSTTKPEVENAARPTAESQEAILTAAEADIEARRFQLAYQRLGRLNGDTAATARPLASLYFRGRSGFTASHPPMRFPSAACDCHATSCRF